MKLIAKLQNVGYRYPDGTKALDNVSFDVYEGESLAIVGPNGGGKSTLLFIVSGLVAPSSGKIRLLGKELNEKSVERTAEMLPLRKKIGVMFQDPDVQLFSATVFDDVAFGPINFGLSDEEVRKKVMRTLKYLKIEHLAERHPYELSGGEKRKAALATAVVTNPDVLILDEPTADLDPKSRDELIGIIKRFRKTGKTVIMATHDMELVPEVAERVIVLNKRVMRDGRTEEVLSDENAVKKAGLEVPYSVKLCGILRECGIPSEDFPLKGEEALKSLKKVLEDCKLDRS